MKNVNEKKNVSNKSLQKFQQKIISAVKKNYCKYVLESLYDRIHE